MQSNISLNFIQITQIINENKIKELNSFLEYNLGCRISCNDLCNRLDIDYEKGKQILRILLKKRVIEMNFKVNCYDEFLTTTQLYYEVFEDIPDELCDDCEKRCQILNKVIIVYKVVKGELDESESRS